MAVAPSGPKELELHRISVVGVGFRKRRLIGGGQCGSRAEEEIYWGKEVKDCACAS